MTHYLKPTGSPTAFVFTHQNLDVFLDEMEEKTADFAHAFFLNLPQDPFNESTPQEENFIDILTTSPSDLYLAADAYDESYLKHQEDLSFEDEEDASIWAEKLQQEDCIIDSFSSSASSSLAPSPTLRKRTKPKTSKKKITIFGVNKIFQSLRRFVKINYIEHTTTNML